MVVVGVIAEYNPLHNGHAWHLALTRQSLAAEAVIVIMSGHFTQRGEPAIIDKWSRAKMAIACGADLVLELPTIYACSRATWFARGAISLLSQLEIVTHLSFGSESGELDPLVKIARILAEEPPEFKALVHRLSKQGLSYPRVQAEALRRLADLGDRADLISTANNILAVEYLRELQRQNSRIIPWTIRRQGAGYHDLGLGPMASATAIRQAILAQEPMSAIAGSLPHSCLDIIEQQVGLGRGPVSWHALQTAALAVLRRASREQLAQLPEVSEGLENRLLDHTGAASIDQWLSATKTKRYTRTRITRTLAHLLLGITKADLEQMDQPVPYARILAMNDVGRTLLRQHRGSSAIPIIHKPRRDSDQLSAWGGRLLDLDRLAADLWVLGVPDPHERDGAQDLTREPVRLF